MSPHNNWFGVTVDALTSVVVELAVAQRVFESSRVDGMQTLHAVKYHAESVGGQRRFRLKRQSFIHRPTLTHADFLTKFKFQISMCIVYTFTPAYTSQIYTYTHTYTYRNTGVKNSI